MSARLVRGLGLLVLALLVPAQAAQAARAVTKADTTTAQQRGLAALQKEIDATVARTGGHRTAVNEVTSADGKIVLTLPLPAGVKTSAAKAAAAATTGHRYGCPYSTSSWTGRWICLYQFTKYNGNKIGDTGPGNGRMLRFQDDGYQSLWKWDFDDRASSVVNTSLRDWRLMVEEIAHATCSASTSYTAYLTVGAAPSAGSYNSYPTLGTVADRTDCLQRLQAGYGIV